MILDFHSERFMLLFIYKSPRFFLPSFMSIVLSVQKWKIDFQDGGHLGFPIRTTLAIYDLQVTPMLPTKFQVSWPPGSAEAKHWFSRWPPFSIGMIWTIFDLQVTQMLPTKFQVNWPFSSGEEVKNRFSRWPPWQSSRICEQNNCSYFWSTSHPCASYQVSCQLAFWSGEEAKKRLSRLGHLGFPMGPSWISVRNDFSFFYLQVTLVSYHWPFGSGEEAKNRFSRWDHLGFPMGPSWIFVWNDLSYFFNLPSFMSTGLWISRSEN